MITPGTRDLSGDRRTALPEVIVFTGVDLTAAVMTAEVRLTPDTPGSALIALATVTTANTEGLRLLSVDASSGIPVSTVYLQVNQSTMQDLPAAAELGADLVLAWDLLINATASANPTLLGAGTRQRYLRGRFTVEGAVTQ